MKLRARVGNSLIILGKRLSPDTFAAPVKAERRGRALNLREAGIKKLLESCARAFVPSGRHVRSHVMTFNASGTRRKVNSATAYNMEHDPDRDFEIDATAAASGRAVAERRAAVADLVLLQIMAKPAWGLSAEEQACVRPTLKSILSVPVFNPDDVDGQLLGTLQVDSDLTMEEAGFIRPESAELLQQFADVLSLLMIGVDVELTDAKQDLPSPTPKARVQNATQIEPGVYIANSTTSIFQLSKARYS
jgi:GAF domain-containing protein